MSEQASDIPAILVADDDRLVVELVKSICAVIGFKDIWTASNGAEAFEYVKDKKPDILVTGLRMDPINGIELTRLLRNPMESPNLLLPIIMMSGHVSVEDVLAARDAGINELLAKPLTAKALFQRIYQIIEHPRPFVMTDRYFGPDRRRVSKPFAGIDRRSANQAAPAVRVLDPTSNFAKDLRRKAEETFTR